MTVRGLWIGRKLNIISKLTIKSYLDNGHNFILYTYEKSYDDLPVGCQLKDANEIVSRKEIFYKKNGNHLSLGNFSDYFRFCLFLKHGEIWSDLDIIPISDLPKENLWFSLQNGKIPAAFLKIPYDLKELPLLAELSYDPMVKYEYIDKKYVIYKSSKNNILKHRDRAKYDHILSRLYDLLKYYIVKDKRSYLPVSFKKYYQIFDGSIRLNDIDRNQFFAIHLFNEAIGFTNKLNVVKDSIFHELLKIHLPEESDYWIGEHDIYEKPVLTAQNG